VFNVAENESPPPLVSHISLGSAVRWLKSHGFPVPEEYTADASGEEEDPLDAAESFRLLLG